MNSTKTPGQIEISLSYSRHVGPKHVHGGLTLLIDSQRPYAFVSRAHGPAESYEATVREVIEETLHACQGHLGQTRVVLARIEWDDVASCELGFRKAAAAATRRFRIVSRRNGPRPTR